MNTVIAMRNKLDKGLTARGYPSEPGEQAPPSGGSAKADPMVGIQRAAAIFTAAGSEARSSLLFCLMIHHSGHEFALKTTLSSVPHKGLHFSAESLVVGMANLGFYAAHRVFDTRKWARSRRMMLVAGPDGPLVIMAGHGDESGVIHDGVHVWPMDAGDRGLDGLSAWSFEFDSARNPLSAAARVHSGFTWSRALLTNFPYLGRTLLGLSLMLAITGLLLPLSISVFFGQVIRLSSFSAMPYLIVGLVLIALFETLFFTQRALIVAWVSSRLEYLVNTTSFAQILRISPFMSERAPPTSQAARLRSFESIRDFVSGPSFASILDIPVSLFSLAVVGFLSGYAAAIMVATMVALLIVFALTWRRISALTSLAADEATELQRLAIETLDKLDLIRSSGMQATWSARIERLTQSEQKAQMRLRFTGLVGESISSVLYITGIICLMAVSATEVWAGTINGPTLLAVLILSLRVLLPFHTLCLSVQRFEQIRRSLRQVNGLMEIATETRAEREKNQIAPIKGQISLVNVGFKSADTRPVFVGLDLEIEPGETIGIHGANGTGKTTVFKMILGMVDITLGTVRIDGVDLRQLPLNELRRRISYVPQRPRIFPGTLRQNLAFANPLASSIQMHRVLVKVRLWDEIESLAGGLDHDVSGLDEDRFSASFRYRFALARALLVNSKLVLIDEIPNALLDGEVGDVLHDLLKEFHGDRTVIIVSHRTDFLQHASRVVALRYGKVPVVAKPGALMERAL